MLMRIVEVSILDVLWAVRSTRGETGARRYQGS
ncbi:hypothetical protein ABIB14_003728 [Arthrobacter sp. UYEF3]